MYLKAKASITNSINRRAGSSSESILESMFEYQFKLGNMYIQKNNEPMKCIKNIGHGKFIAIYIFSSFLDESMHDIDILSVLVCLVSITIHLPPFIVPLKSGCDFPVYIAINLP